MIGGFFPPDERVVFFGSVEKTEGFGTFSGVYGVVNVVCPDNASQVPVTGHELDFDPAVYNYIVKNGVEDAVRGYAQTYPEQKAQSLHVIANHDAGGGNDTEDYGKPIILFQDPFVVAVVRFVPVPHKAVHDVLMGKPGHAFHQKKSAQHNRYI